MTEHIRTKSSHGGIEQPVKSWVRYSVAVYVGLLLAGAIDLPKPVSAARGTAIALVAGNDTPAANPPATIIDRHRDTGLYPADRQDQHQSVWVEA